MLESTGSVAVVANNTSIEIILHYSFSWFSHFHTECSEIADIAFLVDASESMTEKDFVNEKEIIKKIAATFDVGKAKSHLGLISFSTDAHIRVKFGDHLDLRSFQDAVDKIPFAAGGTRFDKAFGEAAIGLFSANGGVRPDLPKVMIILTDGKQSADYDAVPIERSVLPLRHLGVRILALAIGSQVDMDELRQMVNDPKDIHAFKDFNDLLDDVKKVGNETCEIIKRPGKCYSLNKSAMFYIKIVTALEMEE